MFDYLKRMIFGSKIENMVSENENINLEELENDESEYNDFITDNSDESKDVDVEDELLEDGEYSYDNYDEVCCPECGEYLGKGITKCTSCEFDQEISTVCNNCGKPREENIDFCPFCDKDYE